MKTRQDKIDYIYQKISRKDLIPWCKFMLHWDIKTISYIQGIFIYWIEEWKMNRLEILKFLSSIQYIIWNLVMIWDVMNFIDNRHISIKPHEDSLWAIVLKDQEKRREEQRLLAITWFRKDLEIEEQEDEVVDYVYNLIKKYENWDK